MDPGALRAVAEAAVAGISSMQLNERIEIVGTLAHSASMSAMYGDTHRFFQDAHDTRRLADRLESMAHAHIDERDREFIEAANMFFLASVDHQGRPTVSYKGGAPGFVRITAPDEILFPVYDGNGMFLSLGNMACTGKVGLLFIDFSRPRRLRIQGTAGLLGPAESGHEFPGAQHLVRVSIDSIFVNCGRYIHPVENQALSPHVPDAQGRQPFPAWKRIDAIADSLGSQDRLEVEKSGGTIAIDQYRGEV